MVALLVLGQLLIVAACSCWAPGVVREGGAGVLLAQDSARHLQFAADPTALGSEDPGPAHASGGGGPGDTLAARTYVGEVIWGLPDQRLEMPTPADPEGLRTAALVDYAAKHPLAVVELGARRVGWELVQVRPHYPLSVNVLVGSATAVMAAMGVLGWVTLRDRDLQVAVLSLRGLDMGVQAGACVWCMARW